MYRGGYEVLVRKWLVVKVGGGLTYHVLEERRGGDDRHFPYNEDMTYDSSPPFPSPFLKNECANHSSSSTSWQTEEMRQMCGFGCCRKSRRTARSPDPMKEQRRREIEQEKSGAGGGLFSWCVFSMCPNVSLFALMRFWEEDFWIPCTSRNVPNEFYHLLSMMFSMIAHICDVIVFANTFKKWVDS